MPRFSTLCLAAAAVCAALLCPAVVSVAVAADVTTLSAPQLELARELGMEPSDLELSERTKAVLELDHFYSAQSATNQTEEETGLEGTKTGSSAYNYATATKLFWHSVTAYCLDNANLAAWNCPSCKQFGPFTVTAVMDDGVNQGYVGYFTQGLPSTPIPGTAVQAHEPFVVVSFRGTVPTKLSNWIEDLSFSKQAAFSSKYPQVGVHGGFWKAYTNLKARMLVGLDKAFSMSGARAIIVTGHSLGGAMAELAAIDLKLNVYTSKIYATYTQGTPRSGNAAFASLFNTQIAASFREIHQADCVPHLPPKVLAFAHGPTEVWFNEGFDKYQVCSPSNGEDKACSDSLLMPVSVPDHLKYRGVSVGSYCKATKLASAFVAEAEPVENLRRDVLDGEEAAEALRAAQEAMGPVFVQPVNAAAAAELPPLEVAASASASAPTPAAAQMLRRKRIVLRED